MINHIRYSHKTVYSTAHCLAAFITCILIATCYSPGTAKCAITITAREIAGDVVFSGEGSADTSMLTVAISEAVGLYPGINPGFGLRFQPTSRTPMVLYGGNVIPLPDFGDSNRFKIADSSSGDLFGIFQPSINVKSLHLPEFYVSGSELSGTMTFENSTFESLIIHPGTYQASWPSATGIDTLTLNIIPEPTTATLLLVCCTLPALVRRRK